MPLRETRIRQNLHPGQWAIWDDALAHRFCVLVAGRRWGKGEFAAERIRSATLLENRPGDYAFLAPTYRQGRQIIWGKLLRRFPAEFLTRKPNESALLLNVVGGSRVVILGADQPDRLRGWDQGFRGVVLDEYDQFKPLVFEEIVRPMLADWRGWGLFTGTPDGFANLYPLWVRGQEGNGVWKSWRTFKSIENPWLDPNEIEEARRTTDPQTFRQEWEASFEAPAGRLFDDFHRDTNVRPCPFDRGLPVTVGVDFNVDPMTAVVIQMHGDEWWVPHIIELRNSHTRRLAEHLEEWGRAAYGPGDWQSNIEVVCDPTGNARWHNIGRSDISILQACGFAVRYRSVSRETDKWNAVRALVLSADGKRRLFVDPSCRRLIERLEQVGPEDEDDHLTDALGYAALFYREGLDAGAPPSSYGADPEEE